MKRCVRSVASIMALLLCLALLPAAAGAAFSGHAADTKPPEEVPSTDGGSGLSIDENTFPDAGFRAYVSRNLDPNGDGFLTRAEITRVKRIICTYDRDIASLEGVACFTALETLACYGCGLTALDLSGCEALETLYCNDCGLTALDLSGCTALEYLNCADNALTCLDVSGCPALERIECYGNHLTDLDVSECPALEYLNCRDNELTGLCVTGCSVLRDLVCRGNRLTAVALSSRDVLNWFDCADNELTDLDVTGCPRLVSLDCSGNRLTGLELTGCSAILDLSCCGNGLSALDVSPCPSLADAVLNGRTETVGEQAYYYSPVLVDNFMEGFLANIGGALRTVYSVMLCDSSVVVSAAPEPVTVPAEKPALTLSEDGAAAKVTGDFAGLYARAALVLDNSGQSGLFVTQVTIDPDGTILIPAFMVPGLTVQGVSVALVPTLEDVTTSAPDVIVSAFRMLS